MIVKEYMLSKEELKHDFPIGSKHIIDGKEVVVTEIQRFKELVESEEKADE